jgi:hypothetical protein
MNRHVNEASKSDFMIGLTKVVLDSAGRVGESNCQGAVTLLNVYHMNQAAACVMG